MSLTSNKSHKTVMNVIQESSPTRGPSRRVLGRLEAQGPGVGPTRSQSPVGCPEGGEREDLGTTLVVVSPVNRLRRKTDSPRYSERLTVSHRYVHLLTHIRGYILTRTHVYATMCTHVHTHERIRTYIRVHLFVYVCS